VKILEEMIKIKSYNICVNVYL